MNVRIWNAALDSLIGSIIAAHSEVLLPSEYSTADDRKGSIIQALKCA